MSIEQDNKQFRLHFFTLEDHSLCETLCLEIKGLSKAIKALNV
jgi:hypothetical protein